MTDQPVTRIDVHPEPSAEERLAILEVLRLIDETRADEGPRRHVESRWANTARREGLRSTYWPPQMAYWESTAK